MNRFTLKETGKEFGLRLSVVVAITEHEDGGCMLWIDLEKQIGYHVTATLDELVA